MTSCPEQLLGLRRAGQLSASDAIVLDRHLQTCAACAADENLHEAFEKDGQGRATDDRLIARAVEGALMAPRPRSRRSKSLAVMAGLALLIVAGLASAAAWIHQRNTNKATAKAPPAISHTQTFVNPPSPVPTVPSVVPRVAPVPGPAEQPHALPPRPRAQRRVAVVEEQPSPAVLDLKALFAAANEARRSGQADRAGQLYTELQRRFPGSRESLLSHVSYGRLLLDHGHAAEALIQFEHHLRAAAGGVLDAEALYGQARALTQLHRQADARRSWAELLSRFPDSIYADVARNQIGP